MVGLVTKKGHRMTDTTRARRLSQLAAIAPRWVEEQAMNDPLDPSVVCWSLRFPSPKDSQEAIVNKDTGKVFGFHLQEGVSFKKVDNPQDYVGVIDRRIVYLWETHQRRLEQAKKIIEGA